MSSRWTELHIVVLLAGASFSAIVYHVLTIMAVQAGADTRRWHSATIGCGNHSYRLRRSGPIRLDRNPRLDVGWLPARRIRATGNIATAKVCQVFMATITDLGNLWPARASPTKATAWVAEARYFPEPAGHRKHGWVAAPWVISVDSPRSVPRNRRGSSVRSASASRGQKNTDVQRQRRRIHKPHCPVAPPVQGWQPRLQ